MKRDESFSVTVPMSPFDRKDNISTGDVFNFDELDHQVETSPKRQENEAQVNYSTLK